jgi:hypothetical protein
MNDKIDNTQIKGEVGVIRRHLENLVRIEGINNGNNDPQYFSYVAKLDDAYQTICEASKVIYEPITANIGGHK